MADETVVATLGLFYALLLAWGFRVLPKERWQILASLPIRKREDGSWDAVNLTFYGLFIACSHTLATAMLFLLLGSAGISSGVTVLVCLVMAVLCVPSSRLVARMVERKAHTATVGGASFTGIVLAPWCIWGIRFFVGIKTEIIDVLAALAVAYAFGEGMGRLACISFGCCYGKPLSRCAPLTRILFKRVSFVFEGKTKKIAYEGHMDGEEVLPVQAFTSVVYISSALAGTYLFLKGMSGLVFAGTVAITQIWRFLSEFLRADYRGAGRLSAYQWMSLVSVPYSASVAVLFASEAHGAKPNLIAGLPVLWNPVVLTVLLATWLTMFLLTGRSMVTGAIVSFSVNRERIR